MCKELLKMAAEESPSPCHPVPVIKSASTTRSNEQAMAQAPPPPSASMDHIAEGASLAALDHNAEGAAAAALDHNAGRSSPASDYILQAPLSPSHGQCESELDLHMRIMAGANHNSIDGSASVINSVISPSLIPTNADHSSPPGVRRPLQLQVLPHDHDHELVALQDDHADQMSSITSWAQMQSPSKKLHARCSAEKEEEGDQEEEEEEEAEEEGCATPTGRDQRIPQYNQELNYTSGLVCPPAPKKKRCVSKRRRLIYAADHDGAVNYHIAAERRPFLVDPPDLHNFPDCIRALFK